MRSWMHDMRHLQGEIPRQRGLRRSALACRSIRRKQGATASNQVSTWRNSGILRPVLEPRGWGGGSALLQSQGRVMGFTPVVGLLAAFLNFFLAQLSLITTFVLQGLREICGRGKQNVGITFQLVLFHVRAVPISLTHNE